MKRQLPEGIAIIGMSGRFPKAADLEQFWRNLRDGVDTITFFSDEELLAAGVSPALLANPAYVKARAVLEDADLFDAPFFEFSPREAELTDPQIRVFLECAWQCMETAGYNPDSFPGLIGVYSGMGFSSYMLQMLAGAGGGELFDSFRALLGSDKDYLSTWVSYKLNLHGPSLNVQTACSTSLAAVHLACRALLTFECDMALAGGVSIAVPQRSGYVYEPGSIFSSDGYCRSFDARSTGSLAGEGVGAVVLRRLEDAVNAGDTIQAVIRGTAVNNDGRRKVGFTAPAVDGQSEVISMALAVAEVECGTLGYIETHGSGTKVGDPIEVAALNQVYAKSGRPAGSLPIASVKSNIGHLGPAAGIAGLLKTVLAMKNRQIPPSLHFQVANPQIPFERGPFRVNNTLSPWPTDNRPRRAGVSSFGVGGTNAHLILEEPPETDASSPAKPWQLMVLSARTRAALESATADLAGHLRANPEENLADVAFTLQVGRRAFEHRRSVVCRDASEAAQLLQSRAPARVFTMSPPSGRRAVAFLFPGLGDHYIDMGRGLYESEPEFRKQVDFCCGFLQPLLGFDLRSAIYPATAVRRQQESFPSAHLDFRKMVAHPQEIASAQDGLHRTSWAQPSLFVVEYALARLWMSWGILPDAMLGYSLGEYTAACLAGVISIEDSLRLLADRARTIETIAPGAMLAIAADEDTVRSLLPADISVAAVNGPALCVVAGAVQAVERLEREIAQKDDFVCRRLQTSHAFHSAMMKPAAAALTQKARSIRLNAPKIPYISNVTGTWITPEQAKDPENWARHLCGPVRFAEGLQQLYAKYQPVLVEVGPGQMLSSAAEQCLAETDTRGRMVVPSLPHSSDMSPDRAFMFKTLGELWCAGVEPDWAAVHGGERRSRIPLPTYPFERRRYWLERREVIRPAAEVTGASSNGNDISRGDDSPAKAGANGIAFGAHERPDLGIELVAPTNEIEQKIVAVWESLLGIRPLGIHDNFLRLGGNSLLAIRVAAELRAAFQIEFPIKALMTASTPAELALVVEDALVTTIEGLNEPEVS